MKLSKQKLKKYEDNEKRMQEIINLVMGRIKGRDISFLEDLVDGKNKFQHKKLCKVIEDMLSLWEEYELQSYNSERTKKHIRGCKEMYRNYMYITIRSCLSSGVYEFEQEETNFSFLLKMTKQFTEDLCVMTDKQGSYNIPFSGFGAYFGCYNYSILSGSILQERKSPVEDLGDQYEGEDLEEWDKYIEEHIEELLPEVNYVDEDGNEWPSYEIYLESKIYDQEMEQHRQIAEEMQKTFRFKDEYLLACEEFVRLCYEGDVDKFYEDIAKMIDLYLLHKERTLLLDTEETLEVFQKVFDGYKLAKRYMEDL